MHLLFRHRKKKLCVACSNPICAMPGCKKGAGEAQSCTTEGFTGRNLSLQAIIVRIASFTEESFLPVLISVPCRMRELGTDVSMMFMFLYKLEFTSGPKHLL